MSSDCDAAPDSPTERGGERRGERSRRGCAVDAVRGTRRMVMTELCE